MRKPLSYSMYFKGNKNSVIRYIMTLVITVIILTTAKVIISNLSDELAMYSGMDDKYITLYPATDEENEELINDIEKLESVDTVIRCKVDNVVFRAFMASPDSRIYFMEKEDIKKFLEFLNVKYNEDTVNLLNSGEIIIGDRVIKNNNLEKGDNFSSAINLKYVDSIKTDYLISFTTKYSNEDDDEYILIPKKGKLNKMKADISEIIDDSYKIGGESGSIKASSKNSQDTFNIIKMITTIACAITTGVTTYIHYINRKEEIGVLKALGYGDKRIIKRITKEILLSTAIALGISLLIIEAEVWVLNNYLAIQNGYLSFVFNISMLSDMIIIILSIMIFSIVPTWILLKSIDNISLIEGGY